MHVWPALSVKDIDEINKFMQVSSKTSMSNVIFHSLESGSNELQSDFQKINLNWLRKLTHNVTLPNVEFRTSWCTTRSQNPSLVYSTPSKLSAILCEPCSQKSRFFLVQGNFPLYTRGVLGCLLGFWPSGPKPCGGNYSLVMMLNFVWYLDGIKHWGSLVRAAHPFPSLSREYK